MIQHIKTYISTLILLFLFFTNCKNKEQSNTIVETNLSEKINDPIKDHQTDNSKVVFDLVNIKQISNNSPIDSIISKLKKIKIEIGENSIYINDFSASYTIEKSNSNKFFGRDYLYNYYVNFLKENCKIDIKNNLDYIELSYEDSQKKPFKDYFLDGGVAIFMNDFLILQYSDYIIYFKKADNNSKDKIKLKLPFNYKNFMDECYLKDDIDCKNNYPFYNSEEIKSITKIINDNINKNIPETIFCIDNGGVPFETFIFNIRGSGEQDYLGYTFIVNIKDNKLIAKQIIGISPDGEAPEDTDYSHKTFIFNSDLTIEIFELRFGKTIKKSNEVYKINIDGSIN